MSKHESCHVSPASPLRRPVAWALAAAMALTVLAGAHLTAQVQPVAPQPPTTQPAPAAPEQTPPAAGAPAAAEQPPATQPAPAPAPQPAPATTASAPAAGQQPPAAAQQPPAAAQQTPPAAQQTAAPTQQTPAAAEQAPTANGQTPAATAQTTAATGQAPAATGQPPAPVAQVPAVPVITPAMLAQGLVLMNFNDASLASVLNYLSEAAGLVVIPTVAIDGKVTVISRQPETVDQAITQLNTALKDKGYAALRMGRILKVVTLEDAKKDLIPVRSGANPELVEPSDEMITQIIPIRYADAVRLRDDLAPLIPSYAQLSANASSNSLILTDTAANVKRIVEIVQALDTHLSTVAEVRIFRLQYADATSAASLINTIFQQQDTSQQNQRAGGFGGIAGMLFRGGRGGAGGAAGGNQNQDQGARAPRVLAAADTRTNTLVVSGPGDTLLTVEQVVKEIDSNPAEEEDVMVYALKNADASNLVTVLNNLFQTQTSTATSRAATTTGARTTTTAARGGTTGTMARQVGSTANQTLAGLTGQVYVVADTDTNSLLVRTAPKNFELVRTIVKGLDRAIPQVLIKVLIAEVTHENTTDLGAEFSILNLVTGQNGSNLTTDFGVASAAGGLIYKLVNGDTTAILRALETVGKLEVLSRPYILASDNQPATITVGDTVPFISNTRTTDTGQVVNTITYQDIGIILNVTAHINPEGLVNMDVAPEISSISGTTVPISENVNAPVFTKRSAETHVSILDGQTIVIGGLMQDSKTGTISQVPILGDIPLLGALFRHSVDDKKKTELLIFLTPLVAQLPDTLQPMSQTELSRTRIVKGAVKPGAFQEQLEGMKGGPPEVEKPREPSATAPLPPVIPPLPEP